MVETSGYDGEIEGGGVAGAAEEEGLELGVLSMCDRCAEPKSSGQMTEEEVRDTIRLGPFGSDGPADFWEIVRAADVCLCYGREGRLEACRPIYDHLWRRGVTSERFVRFVSAVSLARIATFAAVMMGIAVTFGMVVRAIFDWLSK